MEVGTHGYRAWDALLDCSARPECHSIVTVPARNEEASLASMLDALASQVDLAGIPLPWATFEIILLLNNCTDQSSTVAAEWKKAHPGLHLHVVERTLPKEQAFVGTARRMLMDTAWLRLQGRSHVCQILSTDSDTFVAPDWIARNLASIGAGADAVGGVIVLKAGELQRLPMGVRKAYLRDRRYQCLVAELEDRLDPQDGDASPRHLEHFGASLACTPEIYARAGGMPPVTPLEDAAFVGRLRRIGARLRHDPDVKVYTSARMQGRVEVGLSGQLSLWHQMAAQNGEHRVQSSAWLAHRFCTLCRLRKEASSRGVPPADYLAEVDCDRLVEETFRGEREGEIKQVNRSLATMLAALT